MTDLKISQLPDAGDIEAGDTVVVVRDGATQKATYTGTGGSGSGGGGPVAADDVSFDDTGLVVVNGADVQAALESVDAALASGAGDVSSINGKVGAVVLDFRDVGAERGLQIVGTKCGINGQAGFAPGISLAGQLSRIMHNLPYGCKGLYLVYGGFKVSAAVELPQLPGGGYEAVAAIPAAGGSSYAVGDIIIPTVAANQIAPTLVVEKVTAGAITKLGVVAGGMFGLHPADALAQTSTTGSGTGGTFTLECRPYVCGFHVGFEQEWNVQNDYGPSQLNGILKITKGADYNGTKPHIFVPVGDFFQTDLIIADIEPGEFVGTRVWTNGFGYHGGRTLSGNDGSPALNEYANYSSMTDYAWDGTFPNQITLYNNSGIQPLAIMGYLDTPMPSFVFIGDSITQNVTSDVGAGLTPDTFDSSGNTGWLEKSANEQVAWTNFSSSGDRVVNYLTHAQNMRLRSIETFRPSHVVDTLAVNDFVAGTNFTDFQAQKIAFWVKLRGLGVREIWVPTCTPRSTSTDSFATLVNQTPRAENTHIQSWNSWLRSGAAAAYGVSKVIDLGTAVESSIGSGIWPVGATYDGTHPSKTCSTAITVIAEPEFAGLSL